MVIMMKVTFAISNGRQLVFYYKANIICYVIFLAIYVLVFITKLIEKKMHYNQFMYDLSSVKRSKIMIAGCEYSEAGSMGDLVGDQGVLV